MKTISSTNLKIGDKISDLPSTDPTSTHFQVIGIENNEIQLKPLQDNLNGYIFDEGKDYMSFYIDGDDWYLV